MPKITHAKNNKKFKSVERRIGQERVLFGRGRLSIVNSFLLTSRPATAAAPAAGADTPGLLQPKLSLRPRPEVLLRAAAPGQGLVALALDDVAGEDEQAEQGGRGAGQLLKIVFKNT